MNTNTVVEDLQAINKRFASGSLVNKESLEFAISHAIRSKDWREQLALVMRAILCDHVFEDGNKRTAAAYFIAVLEEYRLAYDPFKIDQMIVKIAKNNITNVKNIRRMIENASRKHI